MKRYVVAILILFLIIMIGIIGLSRGDSSNDTPQTQTIPEKQLPDYATSSSAEMVYTVRDQIVGDDEFKSIRITVSRDQRVLEILDGYSERVESRKTFVNNEAAFSEFLWALKNAGFTATRDVKVTDERGVCSAGYGTLYTAYDADEELVRSWSTSCTRKDGTFDGNTSLVRRLFRAQITDYSKLTSGIGIP